MEDKSKQLRERAKDELRRGKKIDTSLYETDLKVLVEELSIYQIELEHQNQELIHSQDEIQQSNDRYLDLFDNAPVGYLLVDLYGVIKDINQTACVLLESGKNDYIDKKITKIIHQDFQDVYYKYFRTLINKKPNEPCDIKIQKPDNIYFYARVKGTRLSQSASTDPELRLAIIDVSIQKEMELKLL
ncbi:MAG: PAS domain-containing protein, partial [Mariniphaga sp.]